MGRSDPRRSSFAPGQPAVPLFATAAQRHRGCGSTASGATAAAKDLAEQLGYRTSGLAPDDQARDWEVRAETTREPSIENVRGMRQLMLTAAARYHGEYTWLGGRTPTLNPTTGVTHGPEPFEAIEPS